MRKRITKAEKRLGRVIMFFAGSSFLYFALGALIAVSRRLP